MDKKLLVERIRQACKKEGLSVNQLEKELKLSHGLVKRWEKYAPASDTLLNVANRLKVSIDWLLGNTDIMEKVDDVINDNTIIQIQRAKQKMSPGEEEKMINLIKITFSEKFNDNWSGGDCNES